LGVLYIELERYAEAEAPLMRALQIRKSLLGEEHDDSVWTAYQLTTLYLYQKRLGEAEPLLRRILDIRLKHLGPDHRIVGQAKKQLGNLLFDKGDDQASSELLKSALDSYQRLFGPNSGEEADLLIDMAFHAWQRRNWQEAFDLFHRISTLSA